MLLPIGTFKTERLYDVCVPALAQHKKPPRPITGSFDSVLEILKKDDIGIHVAEGLVARLLFGLLKEVVEQGGPEFVSSDLGNVQNSDVLGGFCRAFVIAEKDDLRPRMQKSPACDGISLDDSDVSLERLRSGKNRKHSCSYRALDVTSTRRSASPPNPSRT